MKRIIPSLRLLVAIFTVAVAGKLSAQQDPYTTHYAFNRTMYNPAAVGATNKFCVSILSHYQYLGYEDRTPEFWPLDNANPNGPTGNAEKSVGPKTQMFSFSAPVTKYGGLGIGFIQDKLGYENSTHVKLDGALRYPMNNGASISLGFEANFLQKGLDGSKLKPLAPNDPSIPGSNVNDNHTIFGAGAYYLNPMDNSVSIKNVWFGASVLNLNSPTFVYQNPSTSQDVTFSTPEKHIYLMGGLDMNDFMGNSNLIFHPSVMIKYNSVLQLDATALVEYQQKLWGGVAYRTTADAFSVMLGYSGFQGKMKGLRIGYSYDLTMTKILSVSSGTHELQLNYCFEIKIPPPVRINIVTPPFMHRDSD